MQIIRVEEEPPYGVGLGSILVSLLEPAPGDAAGFNRWYERDHFYAGCLTGAHFFSGRRFVATRELRALRFPSSSTTMPDTSLGSYLALYWIERGHHDAAERWALERVLELHEKDRMRNSSAPHAGFFMYRFAACRDADGVPPEVALEHPYAGAVLVMSERPAEVSGEERERWLLEDQLPKLLPGSAAAQCLAFSPLVLPEASPRYAPPPEGFSRRGLEIYFVEQDPRDCWSLFEDLGRAHEAAGMGALHFAGGFVPTLPGSDRYADEV